MSNKLDNSVSVDLKKREFMGKFGKYAMVGAGMATLMSPTSSSACSSRGNPGNAKNVGCGSQNSGIYGQRGGKIPD